MPVIRVAILEADTPIGRTKEKYGGYGNLFKELLGKGTKLVAETDGGKEAQLDVLKYDVVNTESYPALENVDAVLITGSRKFLALNSSSFRIPCVWSLGQGLQEDSITIVETEG